MSIAGLGDKLASGQKSAQFGGAQAISDFEQDVIYMEVAEVLTKYGLSQAEYDEYQELRLDGKRLPDLTPVALQETMDVGFSVTDSRHNYLSEATEPAKAVAEAPKKYPVPEYEQAHPILDRVLVMIVSDDPDVEILEDGSSQNKRTGLITSAKYRQHSNVGIVLAAGQYVVLSGMRFDMSEFVRVGDKITYGDYNSEIFPMDKKKVEALCDTAQVNYVEDPKGLRVVRVQDIRVVEHKVRTSEESLQPVYFMSSSRSYPPSGCEVRNV